VLIVIYLVNLAIKHLLIVRLWPLLCQFQIPGGHFEFSLITFFPPHGSSGTFSMLIRMEFRFQ